jgi:hypothetical protein
MTEDQYGQSRGTGYVVRGDAVPDDEEAQAGRATPMTTRLKKVASALRGDRPDEAAPDPEATSPNAEEPDADHPYEGTGAPDPSTTGPDMSGTTATAGSVSASYRRPSQADTAAGYGSPADTAAGSSSQAGTIPGYGSQAGRIPGYGTEADTATGYGSRAGTVTDRRGLTGTGPDATGVGTAEARTAGNHAADAADAGLRPGEATDRLGDFGDIAFGNLLPDAGQYTAQWQQIQFRFVDDPQGSVTEAADVVSQVTAKLEAAIQERQRAIEERQRAIQERASVLRGRWGEGSNADTETLRETLRMYRAFMDQLVGSAR